MRLALALGRRGQGRVWPNPAVGCVLVRDGRIVGRGWTQPSGRPHAEVVALAQAGQAAQGATAYVTLEPCAHVGKSGPCAAALIDAGITRCVIATQDPDTRVNGRGVAMLRAAGIEVVLGVLQDRADADHAGFFKRITLGRPRVTLKLAMSLDGRIATATGHSKWITGPRAREAVQADRMRHDAVMVGAGTVRADDPSLTLRAFGLDQTRVRVVVSSDLDFSAPTLLSDLPDHPLWLLHGAQAKTAADWAAKGAQLFEVPRGDTGLDIRAAMGALGAAGLTSVYCEGGGQLAASLLRHDLVDDLIIYNAGLMIGADGQAGCAPVGITMLEQAHRFTLINQTQIGPDLRSHWRRLAP